jgi:predicted phage terminase large subunit-like protein
MAYAQEQLRRLASNYRLTPATLAYKLDPNWIPAPHLQYISARVAAAIRRGNGRLIISAPPRHGKSELITKGVPIWVLENLADKEVILTTYGGELSADFGRQVRDRIQANEALLNTRVRRDASAVANWATQQGGSMRSIGVGGPITGRGADVLLIDDYIKEIKEALSPTYRDYIWNWFVTTAFTRIEPGGTCIIIATRWHYDDLIGRILRAKDQLGDWEYIRLPAEAEEGDILGREVGEPLFPERYDKAALAERRAILGSFFYNAMFQQEPRDDEAALTNREWLKVVDELPQDDYNFGRIWDLAATEEGGDWTVGALVAYGRKSQNFYIVNIVRRQMSPGGVEERVRATAVADGTGTKIYIEQEPGSAGKSLIHMYKETVLPEFDVEEIPVVSNKVVRAQPFLAGAEAGKVYLVKGAWNQAFIDEFAEFPTGHHDDQIDTVSAGFEKLVAHKTLSVSWGRQNRTGWTRLANGLVVPKSVADAKLSGQPKRKSAKVVFGRAVGE